MAQIFISHSAKDVQLKNFLNSIFSGSKVTAVFEEYEKLLSGAVTAEKIQQHITASAAVFLLITENVNNIQHTRDWVVWEGGIAKEKPLWVFEVYSQFSLLSVVVPNTNNYVIYYPNDAWFKYIRQIVDSYDNSTALPSMLGGGLVGALANPFVAMAAAVVALILSDRSSSRPVGTGACCQVCNSKYNVHLPQGLMDIRCPVCNNHIHFT